jgi:hypothetical protein
VPRTPAPRGSPKVPRPPQPKRWAKKLTRKIVVTKGPRDYLLTLDDARNYILRHFRSSTRNKPLDRAIELLIHAADNDAKLADREAATKQLELVLRARHWL